MADNLIPGLEGGEAGQPRASGETTSYAYGDQHNAQSASHEQKNKVIHTHLKLSKFARFGCDFIPKFQRQ